ncbi:MAG: FAD-binding oxidoreductase [Bdellovibrionales bacterium]|nr:FAD-binding oxidoreductase [Bdellovibrionales bacterium]
MPALSLHYDAIVVGAGLYGSVISVELARDGRRVLLVDAEQDILSRASAWNQFRVHNGYHYPRSLTTAYRSHINYARFVDAYSDCLLPNKPMYYAVARSPLSKVTATQFERFCRTAELPLDEAPESIRALCDPDLLAAVYRVEEAVVAPVRLRERLRQELYNANVTLQLGLEAESVVRGSNGVLRLDLTNNTFEAPNVFMCAYGGTEALLQRSGLRGVGAAQELAELAVVQLPPPLSGLGLTVMCGPFFSILPFPDSTSSTLSHVRYTPRERWIGAENPPRSVGSKQTAFPAMVRDAGRYLPMVRQAAYLRSFYEVKVKLPRNAANDGRPILFHRHEEAEGLVCVIGGKLDNVYDVVDSLHEGGYC